jgi:nicotinate-nucleotide--dimethylbenzimidazole phosphoribosyltransferase
VLKHLGKQPLLALDMRLGEGTGAALAASLVKAAAAIHTGMATFAQAGVAGKG